MYCGLTFSLSLYLCNTNANEKALSVPLGMYYGHFPVAEEHFATPLHVATYHGNTEMIKCLLSAKADPRIRDAWGHTPLELATDIAGNFMTIRGEQWAEIGSIIAECVKQREEERVKEEEEWREVRVESLSP